MIGMVLNYTTAVTPYCGSAGIGYTVYYSNGSATTYVIGVNATTLPPNFVVGYSILDAILMVASLALASLVAYHVAAGKGLGTTRLVTLSLIGLAVFGVGMLMSASPLRPVVMSCGSSTYTVMAYDPLNVLAFPSALIAIVAVLVMGIEEVLTRWGL